MKKQQDIGIAKERMKELLKKVFITKKINKIKLKDLPLKEIEFKDGINIIMGRGGTGKTRIMREIISQKKAVNINTYLSLGQKQMLTLSGITGLSLGMCIIIDDFFLPLTGANRIKAMNEMSSSNNQYILTSTRDIKFKDANVVSIKFPW